MYSVPTSHVEVIDVARGPTLFICVRESSATKQSNHPGTLNFLPNLSFANFANCLPQKIKDLHGPFSKIHNSPTTCDAKDKCSRVIY